MYKSFSTANKPDITQWKYKTISYKSHEIAYHKQIFMRKYNNRALCRLQQQNPVFSHPHSEYYYNWTVTRDNVLLDMRAPIEDWA